MAKNLTDIEANMDENIKAIKPKYYCPLCLSLLVRVERYQRDEVHLTCQTIDCRIIGVRIDGKLIK